MIIIQFHTNDKTLLGLLEEERSKYIQLEGEYHKLLSEVQELQTNHLQEFKNQERKHETEYRNLQKALILKSEECTLATRELQQFQARYAKESTGWISANDRLENQMEKLGKDLEEAENRYLEMSKQVQDLNRSRKDLAERLTTKENDLAELSIKSRDREVQWINEKELRMKLEVQALQLDHFVTQRDEEIKNLRMQLTKKTIEAEEGAKAKENLEVARKEIAQLEKREKLYIDELESGASRERQMQKEVDDLKAFQKKLTLELDRLNQKDAAQQKEIEQRQSTESNLRGELADAYSKATQQSDEISILNQESRSLQMENSRLNHDISDLRQTKDNLTQQLKQKESEFASLQNHELQVRIEKEKLAADKANAQAFVQELQGQVQDLLNRLEAEAQSKADMRQQHKEKLVVVADKISELQQTLTETQQQLVEFREMEETLRNVIRQRDDTISTLQRRLLEQQQSLIDTQGELAKESFLNEQLKSKKKEEMLAVQEKFTFAKSAMEDEVQSLKQQLSQKSAHLSSATEELSRLKIEVSTLTADRFRFEARIAELTATESGHLRQLGSLKEQIKRKEQEVSTLMIKHQSLLEQVKRFDSELQLPSFSSQNDSSKYIKKAPSGTRRMDINRDFLEIGVLAHKGFSSASLPRGYSSSGLTSIPTQDKPSTTSSHNQATESTYPTFTYRRDASELGFGNNTTTTGAGRYQTAPSNHAMDSLLLSLDDNDTSINFGGARGVPNYTFFKSQKSNSEMPMTSHAENVRPVPGYLPRASQEQQQQQQQGQIPTAEARQDSNRIQGF
jgi:chromosome segregation ATPase